MKTKLSQSDDDDEIKKRIRRLQSGTTKNNNTNQLIEDLLDDHRRRKFFEVLEEGYRRLKEDKMNDPELREQVEEEQRLWDNTLMDGLEDE